MKNVALITGASSGIGEEIAKIHAENRGDLIIVARRKQKLEDLKQELENKYKIEVKIIVKDLTHSEAALEIYKEVKEAGINVDYLINNAGFGGHGKFHERDWENDLQMIQLNILALTALTRFFLPDFVKNNRGKILNVSSTASLMPGPLQAVYFATKAYVTSFSNAIAEELHDTNITVTALLPGATETEFAQTSGMDKTDLFQNTFSAIEVAKAGYDGMLKGKLNVLAGLTFSQKIMMATVPFVPKKTMLKQIRNMQEVK
ncbi:SDR family NAD(P)-dependent oxidoreductase [Aureivirga sp. CE67]|uniref:SDR family NAD(P)-dependent oxidoreductase n=1 Tax=Aureivirga sp. CE67 TaxID=1788983 RepID=UPI0018CB3417|nr:SDR family oxidoreductase [Aureivirga sp. CE67]